MIARYLVYRDGRYYAWTTRTNMTVAAQSGVPATFAVCAVSTKGTRSSVSKPITVTAK